MAETVAKLVRDRIPEIMRASGVEPEARVLSQEEFLGALLDKLVEEAQEARDAAPSELPGELADLLEVLLTTCQEVGISEEQLRELTAAKRSRRGGFDGRIWVSNCAVIDPGD